MDRTKEMWTPRERWVPEQDRQKKMPNLGEALGTCERSDWLKVGVTGIPIAGWEHRSRRSGYFHLSFGCLGACSLFRDQPADMLLAQE